MQPKFYSQENCQMLVPPPTTSAKSPSRKTPHPKFQPVRYMSHSSHAFCIQLPNNGIEWLTSDVSQRLHRSDCSPHSPSPLNRLVVPRAKFHILKMEAVSCSETLLLVYWTTRNRTSEANILHILKVATDKMFGGNVCV